jgi:AraC-like DNA-binding protein
MIPEAPNYFWFTPSQQLGFQHFRYERTFVYPPRVQDEYVVVLCLDGEIQVSEDSRTEFLTSGQVLVGNSRQWRTSRYARSGRCEGLSLVVGRKYLNAIVREVGGVDEGGSTVRLFCGTRPHQMGRLAADVVTELHNGAAGRSQLLEALGRELLIKVLRLWPETLSVGLNGNRRVLSRRHYVDALDYMQSHGKCDFSVNAMCRSVGLSVGEFTKLFHNSTAATPLSIYNRLLIGRGQTALLSGANSVKEVAHGLGFDSVSHFTALFRKVTGMAPSEVRLGES